MMNLAYFTAQFLKINNVRRVFGLPGGENLLLLDALADSSIEFILVHHETAAGFAASVTGDLTGVPGVCLSTSGPGAVNLVAAAAAATLERSPMLAITADVDSTWQERVQHMKLNLSRLFDGAVKASFTLDPSSAADSLEKAWRTALEPPMGAVHLSLSPDLAKLPVAYRPKILRDPALLEIATESLQRAAEILRSKDQIIFLVGIGAQKAGVGAALVQLAEQWQVPVMVTPKAKGHFPESHPLFAGCFSAYGDAPLLEALRRADAVLGVGLDSVDFVHCTWEIDTTLVNLTLVSEPDPAFPEAETVVGDIHISLKYLSDNISWAVDKSQNGYRAAAVLRQTVRNELDAVDYVLREGTIAADDLILGLRSALPDDGIVTLDVGIFKLLFLQRWTTDQPKSHLVANGLSAMGYAVPAALSAALENPGKKVVAIAGDGALLMYAGELATVARIGRPLVVLVVVDEALSLIRLKQLRMDLPIQGTEFQPVDYRALARAFGLEYRRIDGERPAQDVLEEALANAGPVLVEARIDRDEYDRFR